MIGLINAILVVKFINVASDPSVAIPLESSVAIGVAVLIIPLLDTLRVFAIRIFNGRSPFTPDRNHIHHLLLSRGLGHAGVTLTCVSANIGFIALAYTCRSLGSTYLLLIMLALAFASFGLLYYTRRPSRTLVVARTTTELKPTSKVVTFNAETAAAEHK
jgi:UDP-N-acetylmuramyl pentapeptide phosphotransferase/UDP-N-acetylglucosamine-1-phosphate transferase